MVVFDEFVKLRFRFVSTLRSVLVGVGELIGLRKVDLGLFLFTLIILFGVFCFFCFLIIFVMGRIVNEDNEINYEFEYSY